MKKNIPELGKVVSSTNTEIKNVQRTQEFMTLNRSIASCENMLQLEPLREKVLAYHKAQAQDSAELMANFAEAEDRFSPHTITTYAIKDTAIPTYCKLSGRTLIEVYDDLNISGIETDSAYDGDLTQWKAISKEEFDSVLKKVYNKITLNF